MEALIPKLKQSFDIKGYSTNKNQIGRLWEMIVQLVKARANTKLVLIDAFSTKAFWYAVILARLCTWFRIPYIPVLRGGAFYDRLSHSRYWCSLVFGRAATNIAPSHFLKEIFEAKGFKVTYIPNFLDLNQYVFNDRATVRPKLLWLRSFHKIYNPNMAVRVLREVKKQFPGAALAMVGAEKDGSMSSAKKLAAELNLSTDVICPGYMAKKDWISYSQEFDIFINTSNIDNTPVSVLEAMALGLYVVTTDVGGIPWLLSHNVDAILVPKDDHVAMANSIVGILNHPASYSSMVRRARAKAESFGWNVVESKWIELIKKYSKNELFAR